MNWRSTPRNLPVDPLSGRRSGQGRRYLGPTLRYFPSKGSGASLTLLDRVNYQTYFPRPPPRIPPTPTARTWRACSSETFRSQTVTRAVRPPGQQCRSRRTVVDVYAEVVSTAAVIDAERDRGAAPRCRPMNWPQLNLMNERTLFASFFGEQPSRCRKARVLDTLASG